MIPYYNSKVTITLDELLRNGVKPFDFEYPSFYTGEEKTAFEQKLLDHYRFRQIGQETPARWLHFFRSRLREVMPYYIQLYNSEKLFYSIEDPLESYNLTETLTINRRNEGSSSGTVDGSQSSETTSEQHDTTQETERLERRFSNTPQNSIDNLNDYLTEAEINSNTSDTGHDNDTTSTGEITTSTQTSSESSDTSEETHELVRRGNIGVQPLGEEIKKLRASFLNIDMMVIGEFKDLFLLIY